MSTAQPSANHGRVFSRARCLTLALASACFLPSPSFAQVTDYANLSLEELAAVPISTLGRKQTTLFDTPAATYVVTGDDLHRSGALDLGDALYAVPGLQVDKVDSFNFAISARGFNDSTSNMLLVMMDGRSVYSTTFTGTNWNYEELMLEDVRQIEVQRGPGASLWGANAVNGVINIVTKSADDTIGTLATVAYGDELDASVAVREGWRLNDSTAMRVYVKDQDQKNDGVTTGPSDHGWNSHLVGTRLDWDRPGGGGLTLIGELRGDKVTSDSEFPAVTPPTYLTVIPEDQRSSGGNFTAHGWIPVFNDGQLSVLAAYEHLDTDEIETSERRDTYDLDAQLTLHPWQRHEIITGVTYREDVDDLTNSPWLSYTTPASNTVFTGAFLQDEITLIPNTLSVTLGTKEERNSFSGWENQPSLRGIWQPSKNQRVWVGVSRAAQTPSLTERTVQWWVATIPPSPTVPVPIVLNAEGSPMLKSDHLDAYEIGYRFQMTSELSFDFSLYENRYTDLRGLQVEVPTFVPFPIPYYLYTYLATNNLNTDTHGGEFTTTWRPTSAWKFEASATAMRYDHFAEINTGIAPDPTIAGLTGSTPKQEYKLRVQWDPSTRWSFDLFLRHVDPLPGSGIPAYTGLNARIAWHLRPDTEVELIGQNLTEPLHVESAQFFLGGPVQALARSVFLRLTYRR
jgi:iron complex outermembrane receptor protein